jgi:ABC-type amino acid transport substrate-binding protein
MVEDISEKRVSIKLEWLLGTIIFLIGNTLAIYELMRVEPIKAGKARLESDFTALEEVNATQKSKIATLNLRLNEVVQKTSAPTLTSPQTGAHRVGSQITFEWAHGEDTAAAKHDFVLELSGAKAKAESKSEAEAEAEETVLYPVLNPEQMAMTIPGNWLEPGRYYWRIIPGHISADNVIATGTPSLYGKFTYHDNWKARLKGTGELRIGTSPTVNGRFNFINKHAQLCGFDIDLMHWLVKELRTIDGLPPDLKIKFVDKVWEDLLPALIDGNIDLVISGMTSTAPRERANRGVLFTAGYYESRQILIATKKSPSFSVKSNLRSKTVGVIKNTTNHDAALYLSNKDGFTVDASYHSYADIIRGIGVGKIDYALVDDVFVIDQLNTEAIYKVPYPLPDDLKVFYRKKLGREKEEFAIAVIDEPGQDDLYDVFNKLLKGKKGQQETRKLKKKWFEASNPTCEPGPM